MHATHSGGTFWVEAHPGLIPGRAQDSHSSFHRTSRELAKAPTGPAAGEGSGFQQRLWPLGVYILFQRAHSTGQESPLGKPNWE